MVIAILGSAYERFSLLDIICFSASDSVELLFGGFTRKVILYFVFDIFIELLFTSSLFALSESEEC